METLERKSPITGKEGAEIDLGIAADWTKNHRHRSKGGRISEFFGYEILQRILNQPGCMGIRIYYANSKPLNGWQRFIISIANFLVKVVADADGERHLILTGVTQDGMDQIPTPGSDNVMIEGNDVKTFRSNAAPAGTPAQSLVAEQSMPCPGAANCPKNVLTGA